MSSNESPAILLFEHTVSSYVQKVKIALREKNIPFESAVPPNFGTGHKPPADDPFAAINPRGEVPVLVDRSVSSGGQPLAVFDSTIILEYLEDRFPDPPLLPRDPAARARARVIEEVCDTHFEAVNWGLGEIVWLGRCGEDKALEARLKEQASAQTKMILGWLTERLGEAEWFGGDVFGWADVAVAPILNRAVYYGNGPEDGSALARWMERTAARPSVKKTFEEFRAGAANMHRMAKVFETGERRREYRDHRLEWMVKSGGMDIVLEGLKKNNIRFAWPTVE